MKFIIIILLSMSLNCFANTTTNINVSAKIVYKDIIYTDVKKNNIEKINYIKDIKIEGKYIVIRY